MSKVLVNEASLTAIGDAIRSKNGTEDKYKPSEMAAAIDAIKSGGDGPVIIGTVTTIGDNAFANNTEITSVTIPDSVKTIGSSAFSGCTSIKTLTLGKGLASMGMSTFVGCNALAEVHISDLAAFCGIFTESWGSGAIIFGSGTKLYLNGELVTDLVVPDGVTKVGGVFSGYRYLETIEVGSQATSLGSYAFDCCTSLKRVKMNGGSISLGTFNGCSAIECFDFSGCSAVVPLASEYYPPYTGSSEILVPASLYDEWIVATNWAALADRIVAV